MSWLRRLRALTGDERRALLLAWTLLPLVDIGLRVTSMVTVRGLLGALAARMPLVPANEPRTAAEADHRLVAAAARRQLWTMGCLRRTLVLEALLTARGIATKLHFGARRDGEGIDAHCWLELDGEPVGETPESLARYDPLRPVGGEE